MNPQASVVSHGQKEREKKSPFSQKQNGYNSMFQTNKKSICHRRANRQKIGAVNDKTKAERIVANERPYLFRGSQCQLTRNAQTKAIILRKAPLHQMHHTGILKDQKQENVAGMYRGASTETFTRNNTTPVRILPTVFTEKKALRGGCRRRKCIQWSAMARNRKNQTTKTQKQSVL